MKKIFLIATLVILLLLGFKIYDNSREPVYDGNDKGQFTAVKADFPIKGYMPVKLNDGRVLYSVNVIFDPENNTFYKTKYYDMNLSHKGLVLKDGRVLFFSPYTKDQVSKTHLNVYEKSKYALIYDPKTDKLETSKRNKLELSYPVKVLLNDGRVLLVYDSFARRKDTQEYLPSEFEIFDPEKRTFEVIENKTGLNIGTPFLLSDGRVLLHNETGVRSGENNQIVIFNPDDNSFFVSKHRINNSRVYELKDGRIFSAYGSAFENKFYLAVYNPKTDEIKINSHIKFSKFYQLSDGRIVVTYIKGRKDLWIALYDVDKNKIYNAAKFPYPRCTICTRRLALQNGMIMTYGGHNMKKSNFIKGLVDDYNVEIFNPNTGKFSLAGILPDCNHKMDVVLLNDGRVFMDLRDERSGAHTRNLIYTPKDCKAD